MLGVARLHGDDELVAGETLRRAQRSAAASMLLVSAVASTSAGAPCCSWVTRSLLPAKLRLTFTSGRAAVKSPPTAGRLGQGRRREDAERAWPTGGRVPRRAAGGGQHGQGHEQRDDDREGPPGWPGRATAAGGGVASLRASTGGAAEGSSRVPRRPARLRRPDHRGSGWSCPWLLSKHGEVQAFRRGPRRRPHIAAPRLSAVRPSARSCCRRARLEMDEQRSIGGRHDATCARPGGAGPPFHARSRRLWWRRSSPGPEAPRWRC